MVAEIATALPAVTGAIRKASRMTGASFQYLLATAKVESNLNPNAAGRTSTAKGLFQFVEQTWLATVKEKGEALGYGRYAQAIERTANGQYAVSDPRAEAAILQLRSDPAANAVMAGAFTKDNAAKLSAQLGRNPNEGELYLAHFLGAAGAGRFIGLANQAPGVSAADAFPTAARANPSIFYDRGQPRTVGQVYGMLVGRYAQARGAASQMAAAPVAAPAVRPQVPLPPVRSAYAPELAAVAETAAQPMAQLGDTGPAFHSLFHTPGLRREGVSPIVSALWGEAGPQGAGKPAVMPEPAVPAPVAAPSRSQSPQPLDLFQDNPPDARTLFRGRV